MTIDDLVAEGIENHQLLHVLETFISHETTVREDDWFCKFPMVMKQEVVERFLARKKLEQGKDILAQLRSQHDSSRKNQERIRLLSDAMKYLLNNTLNTSLPTTLALLVQNKIYIEAVVFCLNKAQDCMQAQKFLMKLAGDLGPEEKQKADFNPVLHYDFSIPAPTDIDGKIQTLEYEKIQCFEFIVQLLHSLISKLKKQVSFPDLLSIARDDSGSEQLSEGQKEQLRQQRRIQFANKSWLQRLGDQLTCRKTRIHLAQNSDSQARPLFHDELIQICGPDF